MSSSWVHPLALKRGQKEATPGLNTWGAAWTLGPESLGSQPVLSVVRARPPPCLSFLICTHVLRTGVYTGRQAATHNLILIATDTLGSAEPPPPHHGAELPHPKLTLRVHTCSVSLPRALCTLTLQRVHLAVPQLAGAEGRPTVHQPALPMLSRWESYGSLGHL